MAVFLAVLVALSPAGASALGSADTRALASRDGDNTIFLTWDAGRERVTQATSSRRVRAKQSVDLLTRLVDRNGEIVMRAALKNTSEDRKFRFDGRLVHIVMHEGEVIQELETRVIHTVLWPGDKIVGRFTYVLDSGDYSARTDYERTRH